MIKNSIELAQLLSTLCLEEYTSVYYRIVQSVYDCLHAGNKVYIYSGPQRAGIAQDFARMRFNKALNVKYRHSIVYSDSSIFIEQCVNTNDIILALDEDTVISEEPNHIAIHEGESKGKLNYIIRSKNADRVSEIQKLLLDSLAEELLKHLS